MISQHKHKSSIHPQLIVVRDELISTLGRQDLSRNDDSASAKQTQAPADSAKDPRFIELPTNEEPVLVVEQVCLERPVSLVWNFLFSSLLAAPETYHNRHARRLQHGRQNNQNTQKPPAVLTKPLSARENDQVGDDTHTLEHDGKGHQEADSTPHRAEVPVFAMAVFTLGEALAGIGQRGATLVETIRVVVGGLGPKSAD